ncbi:uncharacterized protein GlcG (DUF336 family) [Roseateles asaccharophilus]|uniref:Uncharacterized protein GlcG (DUF336 family) n=1 Tax=Roseateles asaccharophilus TaxID=582607 RepID=A0ABU2ABG8_9BURK|nr:uncharacterized protein GlcG (DUF336 family) [Roseateles asaccharophilus]
MISKPALTKEDAIVILNAAESEAVKHGWKVSLAVCDDGGHLLAFVRLPGANLASTDISQAKARTATLLKRETKGVEEMINQGALRVPVGPEDRWRSRRRRAHRRW